MKDDLLQIRTRFHHEVLLPDVQRIVDDAIEKSAGSLRHEMNTHFDGVYVRLDRLEAEVRSINGILARIAPYDPYASSSLRTCDEKVCPGNEHA